MKIVIEVLLDENQWATEAHKRKLDVIQTQCRGYVQDAVDSQLWYRDGFQPDYEISVRLEEHEDVVQAG